MCCTRRSNEHEHMRRHDDHGGDEHVEDDSTLDSVVPDGPETSRWSASLHAPSDRYG
jgi:hypothetical protein